MLPKYTFLDTNTKVGRYLIKYHLNHTIFGDQKVEERKKGLIVVFVLYFNIYHNINQPECN
jgi:hypothetical protein